MSCHICPDTKCPRNGSGEECNKVSSSQRMDKAMIGVKAQKITALEAENAALREKVEKLTGIIRDIRACRTLVDVDRITYLALTPDPSPAKPACGCQTTEYPHWSRISYTDGVPYCDDCGMFYSPLAKPASVDAKPEGGTVKNDVATGLEKAAEITRYHASLPQRLPAFVAACRDIEISCLATAGRIRRGEYENPVSACMSESGSGVK